MKISIIDQLKKFFSIPLVRIMIFVALITHVAAYTLTFPYKEVLKCDVDNCIVDRFYVWKHEDDSYYFPRNFSRNDEIQVYDYWYRPYPYGIRIVDTTKRTCIFKNRFLFRYYAEKVINDIKTYDSYKFYKYWIGYKKIEN